MGEDLLFLESYPLDDLLKQWHIPMNNSVQEDLIWRIFTKVFGVGGVGEPLRRVSDITQD